MPPTHESYVADALFSAAMFTFAEEALDLLPLIGAQELLRGAHHSRGRVGLPGRTAVSIGRGRQPLQPGSGIASGVEALYT